MAESKSSDQSIMDKSMRSVFGKTKFSSLKTFQPNLNLIELQSNLTLIYSG